jgi:folate-binding protein YgfZ
VQGQFSNDLGGTGRLLRYGFWLDHKGKVQADSLVLRVGAGEFLVASYFSAAERLREHFGKFIIADDVSVTDETASWMGAGCFGDETEAFAPGFGISSPPSGEHIPVGAGYAFVGRRSSRRNIEVLWPVGSDVGAWRPELGPEELERERIRTGVPAVPRDLGPGDLPNEGGLEDVAISYTKGCFTGQEVMARLKNLGQVRRRLMVIAGPGEPPAPGAFIFQRGKKVGEVRSSVRTAEGFLAFGMMSLLGLDPAAGLGLAPEARESVSFFAHG